MSHRGQLDGKGRTAECLRLAAAASVAPLLAYGCVLTPNRQEAAALTGSPCETAEEMVVAAAQQLFRTYDLGGTAKPA